MKSSSLILFMIGLTIFVSVEAVAAEWAHLEETDEEAVSYDMESIIRPSNAIVRVIVKTAFSEKGIMMHMKEFGERYHNLSYVIDLLEFNCPEKKTRILRTTLYSRDGNILVSDTSSELEWLFIIADSLGETLYKKVCK